MLFTGFNMWLLQSVSATFSIQSDPTLERHFKGHRDTVTSVDFSCNMKQIGNCYFIVLCVFVFVCLWPDNLLHLFVVVFLFYPLSGMFSVVICKMLSSLTCAPSSPSHRLYGLLCDDLEHETSDASVSF